MSLFDSFREQAPRLLALPLKVAPFGLQRLVAQRALHEVFAEALAEGDFDFLEDQWLCIDIDDLGLRWFFSVDSKQKMLVERDGQAQATISGGWKAFLELAAQQKDPDTLFFQRQLMISGDTDLCHGVKNLLDSVELSAAGQRLQRALARINSLLGASATQPLADQRYVPPADAALR